jgi:hypothetical protein
MRRLLTGARIDDPPPKEQRVKFRLALAARKYPVQIALVVALMAACVPIYQLLQSNGDLRRSNASLRNALLASQKSRATTVGVFCHVINRNAAVSNKQTDYLRAILVNSAKSSKPFESVFRRLGLPPYHARLHHALVQARHLEKAKIPALSCRDLVESVNTATRKVVQAR